METELMSAIRAHLSAGVPSEWLGQGSTPMTTSKAMVVTRSSQ
jgi:hypothetical protein